MEGGEPCFARLQVTLDPVPRTGALNMALDEVLLESSAELPLLRLYTWAQPAISFGYFEPVAAACRVARGRDLVRRWTGGGIVEHGDDLTYALAVPRACAFASLRTAESYRRIHAAVARALQASGWNTSAHDGQPDGPGSAERENACFARPVLHDLVVAGRKVAGGAQRRARAGMLHQGSIRLPFEDDGARNGWFECMTRELPRALAGACEERPINTGEIARAAALASSRYEAPEWTQRC